MSLLQDALRRAQKGSAAPSPGAGGSLPGAGGAERPVNRRIMWVAALAAVFLLGAAGAVVQLRSPAERPRGPQPPVASTPPPAAFPVRTPSPAEAVAAGDKGTAAVAREQTHKTATVSRRSSGAGAQAAPREEAGPAAETGTPAAADARAALPPSVAGIPAAPPTPGFGKGSQLSRFNEGIAAGDRGDWETASRLFREAVSSEPSLVEGWNNLGFALARLGKGADAERAYLRALSLDPGYPAALINVGLLRLQEGRPREAAEFFARAAALDPRNPVPRINLAIAQARLGEILDAEETLLGARLLFPSDPDILYHLGTVYERGGKRDRAAEAYKAFLSAAAESRPGQGRLVRERLREWGVE